MEETIVIYGAGNPDAYPMEYYNPQTQCFEGVIPQLLSRFSAQSRFQVVYYPSQGEDARRDLAENYQVDFASGYTQEDVFPVGGEELAVFQARIEGEEVTYYLSFTKVAPQQFKQELAQFFQSLSQEEISGVLVEQAQMGYEQVSPGLPAVGWAGLGVAFALLLAALVVLAHRTRKKLGQARQERERDPVTGLGNVDYLYRYYPQLVNDQNRVLYDLVYLYLDVDRLRRVTGIGEVEGALRYCGVILQEYAGETDLLAKVSENGFALLKLRKDPQAPLEWLERALERIRDYPQVFSKPFDLFVSAGIYPLTSSTRDLDEIIFSAGQVALDALKQQKSYDFFTRETQEKFHLEQQLRATVDHALQAGEFQLYIQFYVDSRHYNIVGGEALSRWMHPEKGLLMPGVFVPFLEREGIVYKLDYVCLRSACQFLQRLYEKGVEDFFLSCNFSRDTFAAPDFVSCCREIIGQYQFPRELLILELTESIAVSHLDRIQRHIVELKEFGVSIALDDFGEGFTSFADLQQYPVNGIKLDKGLVDHYATRSGRAILRAMVQVGHELGLTMLAEGVESQEQADALAQMQCDVIQGFHFYAPVPQAQAWEKILQRKGDA